MNDLETIHPEYEVLSYIWEVLTATVGVDISFSHATELVSNGLAHFEHGSVQSRVFLSVEGKEIVEKCLDIERIAMTELNKNLAWGTK